MIVYNHGMIQLMKHKCVRINPRRTARNTLRCMHHIIGITIGNEFDFISIRKSKRHKHLLDNVNDRPTVTSDIAACADSKRNGLGTQNTDWFYVRSRDSGVGRLTKICITVIAHTVGIPVIKKNYTILKNYRQKSRNDAPK